MPTYQLKFADGRAGVGKTIEFEACDAGGALIIAHREAHNRSAELWLNGHQLCTICRSERDVWQVGQPSRISSAA